MTNSVTLGYGSGGSALDVANAYALINGSVPPCINLDPTSVVIPGAAPASKVNVPKAGTSALPSSPPRASSNLRPTGTPTSAPSKTSSAALRATVGKLSTQNATLDAGNGTLTTSAAMGSPTMSVSWGTNSSVATFGKPDPTEVDLGGGALTTSYSIDVPAGPKGFKPPLSLTYNSAGVNDQHNAQGAAPWVGEGWNMTMGSISWSESNENSKGRTPVWEDSWELDDAFGTSAALIPPTTTTATYMEDSSNGITPSPVQWHTATETYAKVFSYKSTLTLPGTAVVPPCFRVLLTSGIMEEFGCTVDSLEYYPTPDGTSPWKEYITSWLLDLIIEPDGNQIHVTYQRDMVNAHAGQYPADAVLSTVQWDSPSCSNANTACTSNGTGENLWKPLMQVNFSASHQVSHTALGGSSCAPNGDKRCDDPADLSGSGGMGAPVVLSDFVLNDIQVQVCDSAPCNAPAAWNTLLDYQLSYDQSAPPTPIVDPVSAKQESTAGKFTLNQLTEIGDDGTTSLPTTSFTYTEQVEYYEDSLVFPNPATNCGPAWNTGYTPDSGACVLWSESYAGNSYYMTTASNGLGLAQSFTWVDNRDNMHAVTSGGDPSDPTYCTNAQAGKSGYSGGSVYPCDMVDDETWSRISLSSQTNSLIQLTQAGQAGAQTSIPINGTTSYTYKDVYPLLAQECADCVAGYSWGNQDDNDYLDFYNGKFMGFAQVAVSNPDGSTETHKFYSTEGWGVWSTTQVTGPCPAPPDVCHNDPWWDTTHTSQGVSNVLHGEEFELDSYGTNGTTPLQKVLTQYTAVCMPPWIAMGSPAVSGYGNWNGNLVTPLDLANPVVVCDVQTAQVDNKTVDGSTNTAVPDQTTTYTYETGTSPCSTCYGRLITKTTTSNDGYANGSPTTIVNRTAYIWNDSVATSATSAVGPYLINFPAFTDTEDVSGARYQCTYNGYDQLASGTVSQDPSLMNGDLTRQDLYTKCGYAPNFAPTGPITTTYGFDTYGNPLWSNDADGNASPPPNPHLGCMVNGVQHSTCTSFDAYFGALSTGQANALNQTTTSTYWPHASATAGNGFGLWPISTTDANGQITDYTYDALGRQTSVTLPGETSGLTTQTTAYTVSCSASPAPNPCAEIDSTQRLNNNQTITDRAFYDGMGNLVETQTPTPTNRGSYVVQHYFYDSSQRLIFKSIPYNVSTLLNGWIGHYYIPDSNQPGTSYTYDGLGRTISVKDPLSETTSSGYTVACNAPGTNDAACYEQVLTVDPLGHQSGVLTDAMGHTNYEQAYTGNSPYAVYATTKYTYDYLGDLTQILQPDGATTTTYRYNMAGRETGTTDPDLGVQSYYYDQDGNLTESVDARGSAGTVFVGYDGIDRPIWRNTINSATGAYDTYSYDSTANSNVGIGQLTGETFAGPSGLSGSYSYGYDARGQQTSATLTIGSINYPLQSTFDDAGNLLTQTYPDGETVTNLYTPQDWLNIVSTSLGGSTTLLSGATYTGPGGADGLITSAGLGGSNTYPTYLYSASFDPLGRATDTTVTRAAGGATLFDQTRSFDAAGNVTTANTTLSTGTDNQAFCYDEQNRLTWAGSVGTPQCPGVTLTAGTLTAAQYTQSFAYDNMGRLTSGPGGAYTYGDSAHVHAVTVIGPIQNGSYSAIYDAAGNMTCRAPSSTYPTYMCDLQLGSATGAKLTYNNEGQLSNWQNQPSSPTSTAAFLYDGQGNRVVQQTTGGSPTTTVYVGDVEEDATTGTTTTKTTYYYANETRIAMAVNGVFSYLASDGLGSANVTLDANGNVTASQLYAPYGSVRYSSGTMPTDYGFTGQHGDSVTGLDYYGARYYDSVAGQFTSADTALAGNGFDVWGLSRYAYVEGNPIIRTDPTGHVVSGLDCADAQLCLNGGGGSGGGGSTGGGGGGGGGGGSNGGSGGGAAPAPTPAPIQAGVTGPPDACDPGQLEAFSNDLLRMVLQLLQDEVLYERPPGYVPSASEPQGTWAGHQQQVSNYKTGLQNRVNSWNTNGCGPMDPALAQLVQDALTAPIPNQPAGYTGPQLQRPYSTSSLQPQYSRVEPSLGYVRVQAPSAQQLAADVVGGTVLALILILLGAAAVPAGA